MLVVNTAAYSAGSRHSSVASGGGFEAPPSVHRACWLQRWTPSLQGHELFPSVPVISPQSLMSRAITRPSSGSRVCLATIFTEPSKSGITKTRTLDPHFFIEQLSEENASRSKNGRAVSTQTGNVCGSPRNACIFAHASSEVWVAVRDVQLGCGYAEDRHPGSCFHLNDRPGILITSRTNHVLSDSVPTSSQDGDPNHDLYHLDPYFPCFLYPAPDAEHAE